MARSRKVFVGEIYKNAEGFKYEIIHYENALEVTIKWADCGTVQVCSAHDAYRGALKYLNHRSVFGVGFIGYGRFVPGERRMEGWQQRVPTILHRHWRHVLERTVADREIKRYEDCQVVEDWHNFQNFAEWAVETKNSMRREENGRLWHLDKDMVCKGNRLYCPEYCVFLPNEVNAFYTKREIGNTGYPGVNYIKPASKNAKEGYIARCSVGKERVYLGYYDSAEEAFYKYKECKEKAARHLALQWEGEIDCRVIDYLNNFTLDFRLEGK